MAGKMSGALLSVLHRTGSSLMVSLGWYDSPGPPEPGRTAHPGWLPVADSSAEEAREE
jgi:hypothetical protein